MLRALEHYRATGKRLSEQKAESLPAERPYRSLVLGLDFPERAQLYRRIDLRVDKMMENGLLPEAELVYQNRERFKTAAQAIGYKEFFPYFEGNAALEDCVEKLKQASRNYAKRQLTWFRHMDGVVWLDAAAPDAGNTSSRPPCADRSGRDCHCISAAGRAVCRVPDDAHSLPTKYL